MMPQRSPSSRRPLNVSLVLTETIIDQDIDLTQHWIRHAPRSLHADPMGRECTNVFAPLPPPSKGIVSS